jgi:hypothetical protein
LRQVEQLRIVRFNAEARRCQRQLSQRFAARSRPALIGGDLDGAFQVLPHAGRIAGSGSDGPAPGLELKGAQRRRLRRSDGGSAAEPTLRFVDGAESGVHHGDAAGGGKLKGPVAKRSRGVEGLFAFHQSGVGKDLGARVDVRAEQHLRLG